MDFEDWQDRVFPWIKAAVADAPPDELGGGETDNALSVDLVVREFMTDLVITFAVDEGDSFSLLQRQDIPKGMTDGDLFALAKKNLTEQVEFNLSGTSFGGFGILAGGNHEAGALCLEFIWDAVVRQAGGDLVVAIPARDCLFMALASDLDQVEAMIGLAKDIFTQGERTLTDTLLLFHADTRSFSMYGTL